MELLMSWQKVEKAIEKLAKMVKKDFTPDFVVGVARGGLVPAVKISHILDSEFRVIHIRYYNGRQRMKAPTLVSDCGPLKGKVLVVDDVADTGVSLEFIVNHLKKKGAKVKVATIACKPCSRFKPDYSILVTNKWLIFPWEVMEPGRRR
ncbi:MAG: phosphoribosyltransferase family protein [Candidatus Hadarchaeota archaeon]